MNETRVKAVRWDDNGELDYIVIGTSGLYSSGQELIFPDHIKSEELKKQIRKMGEKLTEYVQQDAKL